MTPRLHSIVKILCDSRIRTYIHIHTMQVVIMGRRAQFLEQAVALLAKDGVQAACKTGDEPFEVVV